MPKTQQSARAARPGAWRLFARVVGTAVFVSLFVVGTLHYGLDMPNPFHPDHEGGASAKRGVIPRPAIQLESVAVVLPCAQEGQFAVKTIQSIWETSNQKLLREIIVVDDGSNPPLELTLRSAGLVGDPSSPPVKVLRHEKTIGLIGAKNTGGFAALSDVIVFLDCHVKPRPGWDEAIVQQMSRHGDHRTVVVPQIGMLNADTWEEIPSATFHKACFVSWDIDFPWLPAEYVKNDEVPVMSGGLLAISRQWWRETEGYDPNMFGWGGENIDQSLRTWLCGGRIELAEGSIIAHMFRVTDKPQTHAKYHAEGADVGKNKLRAAKAWMGEFVEKVMDNPEFRRFKIGRDSLGDMSHFDKVKEKLHCSPFTHFLDKFAYIYINSGYIPKEVFQLQETSSGLCLERTVSSDNTNPVVLVTCLGPEQEAVMKQQWQLSNARLGKDCCSGLMHWNSLVCLDSQGRGAAVNTWECQLDGMNKNQQMELTATGDLTRAASDCLGPTLVKLGNAVHAPSYESVVEVERLDDRRVRFVAATADGKRLCAVPGPGGQINFRECQQNDHDEIFQTLQKHGGLEVRDVNGLCFDAAGEHQPLLYSCYESLNSNQVWEVNEGHLCLQTDSAQYCLSIQLSEDMAESEDGVPELRNCDGSSGQLIELDGSSEMGGTFLLRYAAVANMCLVAGEPRAGAAGPSLALGQCDDDAKWTRGHKDGGLKFLGKDMCMDTAGGAFPVLYHCYDPLVSTQLFSYVETIQSIRVEGNEAGGKNRLFQQCLDMDPKPPTQLEVKDCSMMRQRGVGWKKLNTFRPHEWDIWERMQQPRAVLT